MTNEARSARGIQSIQVGGRLLQALIDAAKPLSLRELAALAEITPAQAHAYLVSYKRVGMVVQKFESGPYLLGPMALQLGLGRLRSLPIFRSIDRLLRILSGELNVMSTLSVWTTKGPTVVMVVQARDKRSDVNIRMGTRFNAVNSATGRVFGAFADPDVVSPLVEVELVRSRSSPYQSDVASRDKYEKLLSKVRRQGFATIKGSRVPGIDAVAVPVFDEGDGLAGVVTCIGHPDILDATPGSPSVRSILERTARMQGEDGGIARSA